ncbi:MAG: right-handed parallel beta-helix repeat-containing protein [Planctomycetota bacterium]
MKLLTATTLASLLLVTSLNAAQLKVPRQYPDIGAAIAAAGPGDEVVISAGTYREYVILNGSAGVTVRGKGKVFIRPTTEGSAIQILDCGGVTVENLRVRDCVSNGVVISGSQNIQVEKCDIRDAGTSGISVIASHDVLLDRNTIQRTGSAAIKVNSYGVVVRKNKISDLTGAVPGITVTGHNNVIEQNVLSKMAYNGIVVSSSGVPAHLLIADNLAKVGNVGISLNVGVENVTVAGNRILDSGSTGIQVLGGSSLAVFDNLVNGGDDGLSLLADDSMIARNRAVRCHNGVLFTGDDCDLHGNKMLRSENTGFRLGLGSERNLISSNVMKKSGGFDLALYADPMDNDLVDNQFKTVGP